MGSKVHAQTANCLPRSPACLWAYFRIDLLRMRKPWKVAPDPSHPKSQEKHTLWRSTSTFFNQHIARRAWLQAGRMWRPSDVTPIFFALIHKMNIRCLLLGGRSHEQGMRPCNIMVELCPGPWFDQMKTEISKSVWNESEGGWLDPRSKLDEIQSTIGTHEAVVYCPMID